MKEPQTPAASGVKTAAAKPQVDNADGRKRVQIAAAPMQASFSKRSTPAVDGSAPLVQRALAVGNLKGEGARRLELARNDSRADTTTQLQAQ